MRPTPIILPALCWILFAGAPAAVAQPVDVDRTLRTFDFEERRLGNVEDLPMHWVKATGQNLPHYVNGRLSTDRQRSGRYSFRFDLNGGGLIYRYDAGRITVRPGAHYRVEAWCRTTPLPRARARLSAYFTDQDGHPLKGTTRHSTLYAAKDEADPWARLGVELSAEASEAAFLVIELGLLQPEHYDTGRSLGERTLHTQDIRGTAWFDDVSVSQVPHVTLTTDRPGNLFRRGEPLRLHVLVNDRFTDDLAAQLVVRDATGGTVYQRSGALGSGLARMGESEPGRERLTLDLPTLPPGWYDAALVMSSQGQVVGRQSLHFVHLADAGGVTPPDGRFGVIATGLPFDGWDQLPDLLPMLAVGRVKLALWSATTDVGEADGLAFDRIIERLREKGITPTACLLDVPARIAGRLRDDRSLRGADTAWPRLIRTDPRAWRAELAYLISRYANHLDRWQIGADGSDAFATQPVMREVYQALHGEFAKLVNEPDLAMPWPAWYELEGDLPATVALSVPPSVLPSQLPLYVQEVQRGPAAQSAAAQNLSLSLELIDRERYGREVQIRDLAQRVVYALSAGARRIDIPLPFTVRRQGDAVVQQPQELLMIVRTLTTTLSGAEYKGKVPIAEGVEALLFDRDGQGILALWDRAAARPPAAGGNGGLRELALNLGERPASVDLWGNVTPLLNPGGGRGDGKVTVTVGPTPIFLVDIDAYAARLRASVAIDQPLLESTFQAHARRLRFTNPYEHTIRGMVKLKGPPGWHLTPATFNFTLDPGDTFDGELTIEFPYNSFAGPKTLTAEFMLQGDTDAGSAAAAAPTAFTVPLALKLGLSDVGMQTIALRDGDDVVVQQMVSNYSDRPIDYESFAILAGQARQDRLVTSLAPGRTTVKKYRFKGVRVAPDAKVRVGVKELDGTRTLNEEVPIQ